MNCPRCSARVAFDQTECENCGAALTPAPQPRLTVSATAPHPTSVAGVSAATAIALGLVALAYAGEAALLVTSSDRPPVAIATVLTLVEIALVVVLVPLFLVWFFLIRRNAGLWGPQRRSQGWAIGGWFVPIVFLWFPYQIAADAWRASRLPSGEDRRGGSPLVVGWWVCWLLAWFTGFYSRQITHARADGGTFVTSSIGLSFGGTLVSVCFAAASALFGALMVWRLGQLQHARMTWTPAEPSERAQT